MKTRWQVWIAACIGAWLAASILNATVSSTTVRTAADGNGTTMAFTFPYLFQSSSDLLVYVRDKTTAVETVQTFNVSYTVTGAGSPTGGTVTFTTGNVTPTSNQTVVIVRDPPNTQDLALLDGQALPAAQIGARLDKLTLEVQYLRDLSNRTIRLTTANTQATVLTLPPPLAALSLIGLDASLNLTYTSASALNLQTSLAALTDVSLTSPSNNDALIYNGSKWVNAQRTGDITWTLSGSTLTTAIGAGKVTLADLAAAVVSPAQTVDGTRKITTTAALGPGTVGSAGTGVDAAAADHVHPGPTVGVAAGSDAAAKGIHLNGSGTTTVSESVAGGVHTITVSSAAGALSVKQDSTVVDAGASVFNFPASAWSATDGPAGTVTFLPATGSVTGGASGTIANGTVAHTNMVAGTLVDADISGSAAVAYSKLALTGHILNADINSSAGIVYSKLSLGNSILNADINSAANIAYSKLNLSNGVINNDINSSAAIAYSKLNLSGGIVNADVNSSAAIAYSKLNLTNAVQNADIVSVALSKVSGTANAKLFGNIGGSGGSFFTVGPEFSFSGMNAGELQLETHGVTYGALQLVAGANKLLGNSSGSTNQPVGEIGLGAGLSFSGGNLTLTGGGASIAIKSNGTSVDTAMDTLNMSAEFSVTNTSSGKDTVGISSVDGSKIVAGTVTGGVGAQIASNTIANANLRLRIIDHGQISSDGSRLFADLLMDHSVTNPTSITSRGFIPDVYLEEGITSAGGVACDPYLVVAESPVTANVSVTNTPGDNVLVYNRYGVALKPTYNVTVGPFAAPGSGNFRNDIVVISNGDGVTGSLTIRSGTGGTGNPPSDPTLTDTDIPLARVRQWGTTTNITSGMIDDLRQKKGVDGYHLMPRTVANTAITANSLTLGELAASLVSPAQTVDGTRRITTTAALAPGTVGSAGTGVDVAAADHVHPGPTMGAAAGSDIPGVGFHINGSGGASVSESVAGGVHTITVNAGGSSPNLIVKSGASTIDSSVGTENFLNGNFLVSDGPAGTVTVQLATSGVTQDDIASNAVTTAKINAAAVTYAKIQNVADVRLLGNATGGAATPSEVSVDATMALASSTLGVAAGGVGATQLASNAVTTAKINGSAVTYAKIQNETAQTILANPTTSAAAPAEITLLDNLAFSGTGLKAFSTVKNGSTVVDTASTTVTYDGTAFLVSGSGGKDTVQLATSGVTQDAIAANAVTTAKINAAAVTYAKIQNVADVRLLGNATGGAAAPSEVSVDATMALASSTLGVAASGITATQLASNAVTTAKINAAAVTYAKIQNVTDVRLLGNATGGAAAPSEVSVDSTMALASSTLGVAAGGIGTTQLAATGVTTAKIAGSATRGQMLKTTTASAAPTWADAPMASVSGGYVTRSSTNLLYKSDVSNRVWCFESSSWVEKIIPDGGITVACTGLTASTDYFLYVYDNSGTLTLDLSTTGTTTQNDILVKSGTTSRTLIARCRANGSGAITTVNEDAATQLVCNVYNRRLIGVFAGDTTNSWTYQSATYREFNGGTAAQVTLVQLGQDQVSCEAHALGSTGAQDVPFVGIGVDSTSSNTAQIMEYPRTVGNIFTIEARLFTTLTAGFHTIAGLEACDATVAAVTFVGKDGATGKVQTGVMVMGRF